MGYFPYLATIEYFRLKIEYLRNSIYFKKDGAKRHPQIFNLQSKIFNLVSEPQIVFLDMLISQQFFAGSLHGNFTIFKQVATLGDFECMKDVLFGQ